MIDIPIVNNLNNIGKEEKMAASAALETLNAQVAGILRNRILSGELAPGSRILEVELADELGLSRGTLRTALQQLGFQGLVVQKQFRSTYVASLTSWDAYEIYTLRNTLEAMATRIATKQITAQGRVVLDKAIDDMAAAVRQESRRDVIEADYVFHRSIFEMTGHERLQAHYRLIEPQTRLYLRLILRLNYDLGRILDIHRGYADAIKAGNVELAESLARDHNTPDGERSVAMLRDEEGGVWDQPNGSAPHP